MKSVICLYIFVTSLHYVLLSDVITTERTTENEVDNSIEDKKMCTCNKSYCVCCEYLNWKLIHVNGLTCIMAKYTEDSAGIILSVTYNDTVIIEQNLSLKKIFPICIKNNIFGILPGSLCIQAYNVVVNSHNIHACFRIEGHWFSIDLPAVNLGCINITKKAINKFCTNDILESLMNWYKRKTNNVC
ncbi:uncharacterized protein LOC143359195 [Halictus rubicundus]|uniref:uncharacterized protein LOC143359195 n=1 Tax=Halictus rubicundus TaxID=77578 RepID=UPI0040360B37